MSGMFLSVMRNKNEREKKEGPLPDEREDLFFGCGSTYDRNVGLTLLCDKRRESATKSDSVEKKGHFDAKPGEKVFWSENGCLGRFSVMKTCRLPMDNPRGVLCANVCMEKHRFRRLNLWERLFGLERLIE